MLILAIISLVVLIASFARYTGVAGTANDTAKVATWNVTLDGTGKIFKHTYTKNLTATDESGNYIIAPGVDGSYVITVTNNGDVAASLTEFTLTAAAGNAAVPMQYSIDGTNWTDLAAASTALQTAALAKTVAVNASETVGTLYWKWPYTAETPNTDTADTALGTASAQAADRTSYGLNMSITATQIAPTK